MGELKQRIRDTLLKLNGKSEPGDIYTIIHNESLPFLREKGTKFSKLPEVLKEELMLIRTDAEKDGDEQLKGIVDSMFEENRHFQRLGNEEYMKACITSELSKKERTHGPEFVGKMIDDLAAMPNTEDEMNALMLDKFKRHCETNQFMKKYVYDSTIANSKFEPKEMANALRTEGLDITLVDRIRYDITVELDGKKETEQIKIVYLESIDGIAIEVSNGEVGKKIIREMMRVFGFPVTVIYKEKHEPQRLNVHFCLGFNDDEINATILSTVSNSVNSLVDIENSTWTPDDFKDEG